MSTTIDERVVSMEFDNKNFEKNVDTSLKTLDRLKERLKFNGASEGLEQVNAAALNVRSSLESSEYAAYRSGFHFNDIWLKAASVFEYQVAGRIVNAASNMFRSLAIQPISTGLQEYETQLNSVQTILANTESKGSTLEDVNAALDELNTYADKTIYNFTEMTRNIGTFTAAGVDLDTSVSAIKGIANLAAVSGSTSQQASTAMYQLSQALASGTVKLMDWNSVVNAGMGGQVFQDALKETARVHGVAIDDIIESQGSFRESLSEGWLTSEILTDTLAKFTGDLSKEQILSMGYTEQQAEEILKLGKTANDAATKVKTFTQLMDTMKEAAQSGWAQTWETIIGDFEQAKVLWTGASDVFGGIISASADARNKMLSGSFKSGWDQLLDQGIMDEDGYKQRIKEVAREHKINIDKMIEDEGSFEAAIRKCFQEGSLDMDDMSKALGSLTESYSSLTDEQLAEYGYTREQVEALQALNDKMKTSVDLRNEVASQIKRLSGRELLFRTKKNEDGTLEYLGAIPNILKAIGSVIKPIGQAWKEIFKPLTSDQLYKAIQGFEKFTKKLILTDERVDKLKRTFKGLFAVLEVGWILIKNITKVIVGIISKLGFIGDAILSYNAAFGDMLVGFRDFIKGSKTFSTSADTIVNVFGTIVDKVKLFFSVLKSKFQLPAFDGLSESLSKLWNGIKTVGSKIGGFFKNLGTTIAENLTAENIEKAFDILCTALLTGAGTALILGIRKLIKTITKSVDLEELLGDLIESFSDFMEKLTAPLKAFTDSIKANALKSIATAVLILVGSIIVLSFVDQEKLYDAISAIGLLVATLVGSLALMSKIDITGIVTTKITGFLLSLSVIIFVMSGLVKRFSKMSWDELIRGIVGVGATFAVLAGAMYILDELARSIDKRRLPKIQEVLNQLLTLTLTLYIVAGAMKIFATMSWDEIARALVAMTGALSALVGTVALLAVISKKLKSATLDMASFTKLAWSMILLATSLKILATMSWGEIGRSLTAMTGALVILLGSITLMRLIAKIDEGGSIKINKMLIRLAAMLATLATALKVLGTMSWEDIARALTAMTGALIVLMGTIALLALIDKIDGTVHMENLILLALNLFVIGLALKTLGSMDWETIKRGLTTMTISLGVLIGALAIMSKLGGGGNLLVTSFAILVLASAMTALVVPLAILGNMNMKTITKGLGVMAAALILFGAAGYLLAPVAPALLAVAAAAMLFGGAMITIGIGVTALSVGLYILIKALGALVNILITSGDLLVKFILSTIEGVIGLIPTFVKAIGEAIVGFLDVIIAAAPKIGKALVAVLFAALDVLVQVLPKLAESLFKIIIGLLDALVQFVPHILKALFKLILAILDGVIDFIPKIVEKVVKIIETIFTSVVDALQDVDTSKLIEGLKFVGIFAGIIAALAIIAPLIPAAMIGVVGMGLIAAELALVLMELSKLSDISGIYEGISEAGKILGALGEAIGQFIGGLAGGVAKGFTKSLPDIADNLSDFMEKLEPFLEGIKNINSNILSNTAKLVGALLLITAASVVNSFARFVTGGSGIKKFSSDLVTFGKAIKDFSKEVEGINIRTINTAAEAGVTLAKMASEIPTTGGLWQALAGKHDLGNFAVQIASFGKGIASFTESLSGVTLNEQTMTTAVKVGTQLAKMASEIPTTGGLWQSLAGSKNLSTFATQVASFGEGIKNFMKSVNGANFTNVNQAIDASNKLAKMASDVPTSGGLWQLLAGGNNLQNFALQIAAFGQGLKHFLKFIEGANFTNVIPATDAGMKLAKMASEIPVSGGLWQLIAGGQSLDTFAVQVAAFGLGLRSFVNSLEGANFANIEPAANAGVKLATMASKIPTTGGLWSLIAGEQSLSTFAVQIASFGLGIKNFAKALEGASFANIEQATKAGVTLAKMASQVPTTGGLWQLIAGGQSLETFAVQIVAFGMGLKGFTKALEGADFTNIEVAANAGLKLGQMSSKIPTTGGLWSLISGDQSLSTFALEIASFGLGLRGFMKALEGADLTYIEVAAKAGLTLAKMASKIPTTGGLWQLIAGGQSLATFGTEIKWFGKGLSGFIGCVKDLDFSNVNNAIKAGEALAKMAGKIPSSGLFAKELIDMFVFQTQITAFGKGIKAFAGSVSQVKFGNTLEAAKIGVELAKIAKNLPSSEKTSLGTFALHIGLLGQGIKSFANTVGGIKTGHLIAIIADITKLISKLKSLAKDGVKGIADTFNKGSSSIRNATAKMLTAALQYIHQQKGKFKEAGQELVEAFEGGIERKAPNAISAFKEIINKLVSAITGSNLRDAFFKSGSNATQGFINGLKSKTSAVTAAGRALGRAALNATNKALDERSPSKEYEKSGLYAGEGLVMGLDESQDKVYTSAFGLGKMAVKGLKNMMSKIGDLINSDMEVQPTITPVLNLDEVRTGIGTMNGMFSISPSVGALARAASINTAVNSQIQNGGNGDVVSAIKGLQSSIEDNPREAININGITYSEGTELADAIKTIIRIAKIEGRV